MKVLLCTPFDFSGKTPGGISVWAKNISDYYRENYPELELDLYSCTRSHYINENTGRLKRIYYGVVDYIKFIREIRHQVKKHKYDVVHVNSTASLGAIKDIVLCRILRKRTKVVIHYHFGRIPILSQQKNLEWKMVNKTIKLAHKVIVMDARSYDTLKSLGFSNVTEIPNPYSPELEQMVASLEGKVERKKRRVLFISRVFRLKGIYELVTACSKLKDIELRIVGPYEEVDRVQLEAIAGNPDWMEFVGPVSYDKVIDELMSCEICCLPTYSEGFPNIVMECMISKTPLITTPVGAIPQMLDIDGAPCGITVEPRNVEELTNAISCLLSDQETQAELVGRGYERVVNFYNIEIVARQLYNQWQS